MPTKFLIALTVTLWLGIIAVQPAMAQSEPSFKAWLKQLRREALAAGISKDILDQALAAVHKPEPKVVKLDRNQPEKKQRVQDYITTRIDEKRISRGQLMLRRYPTWLGRIEDRFGVQQRFIVALWGIETFYGRYTGGHDVIQALVTLAFDGRRGQFFRKELLSALQILEERHVSIDRMKGSWAGAMGQCQFMPSSFFHYGQDGNGDGRIDIWGTLPDVFASTANYLKQARWRSDQTWGREVRVPRDLDPALSGLATRLPLARWQQLGVRRSNGKDLPQRPDMTASLLQPDGPEGPSYLVYDNYRALLRWNRSHAFALAVGILSDSIVDRGNRP
jgi:membrane-bound lytic murein transglycosylase B